MNRSSAAVLLRWLLCGLSLSPCQAAEKKFHVLTSFLPVHAFTINVAGDAASVECLLSTRADPHEFNFSRADLQRMSAADLIVINGLDLEGWLKKAMKAAGAKGPAIVEAAAGLSSELITESAGGGHHPGPNPHVWLDPRLAAHCVTNIQRALQKADPCHAADYEANARAYLTRLHALDLEIEKGLAEIKYRKIVTYHDAFPYFARRYGLQIIGFVEKVPDVKPSPQFLSALGQSIRDNHVPVIFIEAGPPPKLATQIARDLKVALAPLDTMEAGPLVASAYEDGMRANLRVLQQHLK